MNEKKLENYVLYDTYGTRYDFSIMEIEQVLLLGSSYQEEMNKQNFFKIVYVTEGQGVYYSNSETFEIKQGDICFISNFQQHRLGGSISIKGYLINFRSIFLTKFITNHLFIDELMFFNTFTKYNMLENRSYNNRIENAIQNILNELKLDIIKDVNLIRIYLLEILLVSKCQINKKKEIRAENLNSSILIEKFEQLVEKYFFEYRFPKDYAKHLMVTPNYLNNVCRKIKGISAGDLIRNRILLESKRLLMTTNLSINQIAYRLNFKDNSYFTRFFKKYVQLTPDEYRRKS